MSNRLYKIGALLAAVLALGSCVKETQIDPTPDPARVLLVYVGTDNNLSGLEQAKLQGLRDGWTGNENDRIIAYIDDRGGDARLIEISNLAPGESPRRIANYGAENSASAATFSRVIGDVVRDYPADSYGLLVFSHASGWLPEGIYNGFAAGSIPAAALSYSSGLNGLIGTEGTTAVAAQSQSSRSVIIDGTAEMELADFAAAIPSGVFDYIVFEACFMAGIEVAYELRDKAPYILASSAEIVDPGFAPVYSTATAALFNNNLSGFGMSAFNRVLSYADNSPQRSSTLTVIRTAGLNALTSFIRENCDFTAEVDITEIQKFDRLGVATLFFDFEDYYGRLLSTDAKRSELARLVADCVSWKAATDGFMNQTYGYNGFTIAKHSGLTTYIPQEHLPGLNAAYAKLSWVPDGDIMVNPWVVRQVNAEL